MDRNPEGSDFSFSFFPWTVTFSKRMEFRLRVEGEEGVFAENIARDLLSEGVVQDYTPNNHRSGVTNILNQLADN